MDVVVGTEGCVSVGPLWRSSYWIMVDWSLTFVVGGEEGDSA